MTDTIIVALISSGATLLAVYLKLKLDKKKNKRLSKRTEILLEDLKAKKAIIVLNQTESDSEFDFISNSAVNDFSRIFKFSIGAGLGSLEIYFSKPTNISRPNIKKIKKYTNFLKRKFT
tara:strand:+ start:105 stop:461 length:357 start_codon:yes stop_codon:yes gene_type:complete